MKKRSWPSFAEVGQYVKVVRFTRRYWETHEDLRDRYPTIMGRIGLVDSIDRNPQSHWIDLKHIVSCNDESIWVTEYEECDPSTKEEWELQRILETLEN